MSVYIGQQPLSCRIEYPGGSRLVMAILSDGLEIEAVFQSLCPSFEAPVLTSPSGL